MYVHLSCLHSLINCTSQNMLLQLNNFTFDLLGCFLGSVQNMDKYACNFSSVKDKTSLPKTFNFCQIENWHRALQRVFFFSLSISAAEAI